MTALVIVALAIAWVIVLTRGRGRVIDPVASVDQQRRALDAIGTAAQTARRSRRRTAPAAGAPPGGPDSRRRVLRTPIVGLAVVTAVSLGVGVVMLPDRIGRSERGEPATPRPSTTDGTRDSDRRAGSTGTTTTTAATTTTTESLTGAAAPPLRSEVIGGDPALQHVEVGRTGFEVTVEAERPCWVQVRSAADAPVTFEATLPAGGSQTFPADATLWLRLGAPDAVQMRVDGKPLVHSTDGSSPANFTFAVAAGAAE